MRPITTSLITLLLAACGTVPGNHIAPKRAAGKVSSIEVCTGDTFNVLVFSDDVVRGAIPLVGGKLRRMYISDSDTLGACPHWNVIISTTPWDARHGDGVKVIYLNNVEDAASDVVLDGMRQTGIVVKNYRDKGDEGNAEMIRKLLMSNKGGW